MFENLWNLKIQIIPVIISMVICEIPGLTRWFKRIPYVPIYFSVFPFSILNRDLSIYLGEDWAYGYSDNLTEENIENLRKKIIKVSIISTALSVVVTPFVGGFLSAFFLPKDSISGFCFVFIGYKLIGMTEAAYDFGKHALANNKTMTWFLFVYLIYFGLFLHLFSTTYNWAEPFLLKGDWFGLLKAGFDELFGTYIFSTLILGLLSGLAINAITDRKLREQIKD